MRDNSCPKLDFHRRDAEGAEKAIFLFGGKRPPSKKPNAGQFCKLNPSVRASNRDSEPLRSSYKLEPTEGFQNGPPFSLDCIFRFSLFSNHLSEGCSRMFGSERKALTRTERESIMLVLKGEGASPYETNSFCPPGDGSHCRPCLLFLYT
jgi:hypothetical protein